MDPLRAARPGARAVGASAVGRVYYFSRRPEYACVQPKPIDGVPPWV